MTSALPSPDDLEAQLDEVRKAYERYFAGLERILPQTIHDSLKAMFRQALANPSPNTALRFRINTLRAKLTTYEAHWARICRQIEEGTFKRDVIKAEQIAHNTPRNRLGSHVIDKLHEAYTAAQRKAGIAAVDRAAFAKAVEQQTEAVRQKYGCTSVRYNITVKDGKAVLQIRPK